MDNVRTIEFAQYGLTNLHPLAIGLMACMSVLVIAPNRSGVILAVLSVGLFLPMDQRVVIGGLDFSMLRLILILAWVRIAIRGEYRGVRLGKLDRFVVMWVFSAAFFYVLRTGPSGIVFRLGILFDVLTAFFLIRVLVRTPGQVSMLWKNLARIVLVLSPFFLYEAFAHYNAFGVFDYTGYDHVEVRNGRARAQGAFSHPILAGSFGSAVLPVFVAAFASKKKGRWLYGAACVGATIITGASGSSGPLMAWAIGLLGWLVWPLRKHMRTFLGVAVCLAVVVHFVREKPIWHLMIRLSSITGGHGYHRYRLIDAFVNNFSDWAPMGTSDKALWGWGLQDTTNYYVAIGTNGGLVTLILFILTLRTGFIELRLARKSFERQKGPKSPWALLAWGCSVSLATHCVSFMSVAYFGHMVHFFVMFVATVPALVFLRRPRLPNARERRSPAGEAAPVPAT